MNNKLTIFIVVGRLGKSLTVSKVMPFAASDRVGKILVFRECAGYPIDGAEYVTLPELLLNIKPAALQKAIRFLYEPVQLLYYSMKYNPDCINGVYTLPKGLNATIAALLTGTKSVVSVIGGEVEINTRFRFASFFKKLNLWMLRTSAAVTTKGTKVNHFLTENGIAEKKLFILNGSIDTEIFYYDPAIEKDIDILFVGTFRKLKGPDRVLEVVRRLKDEHPRLHTVFLGDGYMYDDIRNDVRQSGLQDTVSLPGYIDHPAEYYRRAKSILIPSMSEGLPTAMLEAMACGCVPVVSDVGNIADAAHHGVNAMVVDDWNDINTFTRYTQQLLCDPKKREAMAQAGSEFVHHTFAPEKQKEVVEEILDYMKNGNI